MKKQIKVKITHTGEDYVGIEINGEYKEVSKPEGRIIKTLINVIYDLTE